MQLCRTCKLEKSLDDFYFNRSKQARSNQCKSCAISYQKARYLQNPEPIKATAKQWAQKHAPHVRNLKLQREYGISSKDYDEMFTLQDGKCAICKEAHDLLDVDHCHTTNKVRGLLCRNCNQALGKFRDSIEILQAAISYLT
jgi:hypothetical protein